MQLTRYFGDRDFWSSMLRLTLPIAFQSLLVSSFALVDTVMIGALGGNSLAAVGVAGQLSWMLNIIFFGFTSGAAVFIAQYWGVGDMDGIRRSYGLALTLSLTASILFMLAGAIFPRQIIGLFTPDQDAIAEGTRYLSIACYSYVALAINQIACTVLRSTENVKLPMYVSMVSVAANAVLNALLIYAMGLGVRGAAIATVISSWIAPIVTYIISFRKKNVLIAPFSKLFDWSRSFVAHYLKISLPVLFNESTWALGTVLLKGIFSNADLNFFAALTAYYSIENISYVFFVGMCHASAVMVGKRVGAGDLNGAQDDARRFAVLVPVMAGVVGLLVVALRKVLVLPFDIGEANRQIATSIMLVAGLEVGLRNVPYINIVGIFRAGGDTRTGVLFDLGCLWGIALPVTYLCANVFHLNLILTFALMLLSEDVIKSLLCFRHFASRRWIRPVTMSSADSTASESAG